MCYQNPVTAQDREETQFDFFILLDFDLNNVWRDGKSGSACRMKGRSQGGGGRRRLRRAGAGVLVGGWAKSPTFLGRVFLMRRRTSCLCPSGLFLGCRGSKCFWILNSGGPEGEAWSGTGASGSLGGAPSEEEAAVTQLLPAAVEILSSESQAARPQQTPPWGLDRDSSMCVLWPTVRLLMSLSSCLNLGKNPRI